jgi:hypothetical protein
MDDILNESKILQVAPLDEKKFIPIKESIEKNPPMHPDLKRKLEYYTTYFLWIEMKFRGANISKKTITVPRHVLPINSDDLRKKLSAQLKLFENIESAIWYYKLKKINDDVNNLRKKYLTPVKAKDGKNIILKNNLLKFNEEFDSINQNIAKVTSEVKQKIKEEIDATKERFHKVLTEFYLANPNDEMKKIPRGEKKATIGEFVTQLVRNVDFPEAEELLEGFSLSKQEFELTEHDLSNKTLIKELVDKGILNDKDAKQLGKWGKGFQGKLFEIK